VTAALALALTLASSTPTSDEPSTTAEPATMTVAPPATTAGPTATKAEPPAATTHAPVVPAPAAGATTAVPAWWDCFVDGAGVDCAQLEAAFFATTPVFARAAGPSDPTHLRVLVRSVAFVGGVEYRVEAARGDDRVLLVDRVPETFTDDVATAGGTSGGGGGLGGAADTGGGGGSGTGGGDGRGRLRRGNLVIMRLVAVLQRAVAPLLVLDRPAVVEGDALVLRLRDPTTAAGQARADDVTVPWYVSPTVSVDVSQTALLRTQGRAQVDANWSTTAWRLWSTTAVGGVYLQAPGPRQGDPPRDFGYLTALGDFAGVASLVSGLSVGVTARAQHAPEQNLLFRASLYGGLEWVLVPFLETRGANVGVRYQLGAEHQEYVRKNVRLRFEENALRHRAVAFATWHLPRFDVSAALQASSLLKDATYSDVAGTVAVAWRVVNDVSIVATASASYRNALWNAPDNLNDLDPLERFTGGGNYGAVNFAGSLSFVYVLGNSVLLRQDQRFSNVVE